MRCVLLFLFLLQTPLALGQFCTIRQITDDDGATTTLVRPSLSGDGQVVSLSLSGNPDGNNPEGNFELYRWTEAAGLSAATMATAGFSVESFVSRDGRRIVFESDADLAGSNADANFEVFLWDQTDGIIQLTDTTTGFVLTKRISGDGRRVFLSHSADMLTGPNPDQNGELYLWEDGSLTRLTNTDQDVTPRCTNSSGTRHGLLTAGQLVAGQNTSGVRQLFLWRDGEGFTQLTDGPQETLACAMSADGLVLAVVSTAALDPGVTNPGGLPELFLYRNGTFVQLTQGLGNINFNSLDLTADGRVAFFLSNADFTGDNSDGSSEYFAWSEATGIVQLTNLPTGGAGFWAQLDDMGRRFTFHGSADLTGANPDLSAEAFLADCGTLLAPPAVPVPGLQARSVWGLALALALLLSVGWFGWKRRQDDPRPG